MSTYLCTLPGPIQAVVAEIKALANRRGDRVFLVGGMVRDLLMGVSAEDIDIAVEGDGLVFAFALADQIKGTCLAHREFGTACVTTGELSIDVVSTRKEHYPYSAALPEVAAGSLEDDLARRDFTINAMAVCLTGDECWTVVDPFQGQKDLRQRQLRVLHDRSFTDDPTRLFRIARLAGRLKFAVWPETAGLVRQAVAEDVVGLLTAERFTDEVLAVCDEMEPLSILCLLSHWGVIRGVDGEVLIDRGNAVRTGMGGDFFAQVKPCVEERYIWLALLLEAMDSRSRKYLLTRMQLPRLGQQVARLACNIPELLANIATDRLTISGVYDLTSKLPLELVVLLYGLGHEQVKAKFHLMWDRTQQTTVHISGKDLMQLGYEPGPVFGEALMELKRAVLDGKVSDRNSQLQWIVDYMKQRS